MGDQDCRRRQAGSGRRTFGTARIPVGASSKYLVQPLNERVAFMEVIPETPC